MMKRHSADPVVARAPSLIILMSIGVGFGIGCTTSRACVRSDECEGTEVCINGTCALADTRSADAAQDGGNTEADAGADVLIDVNAIDAALFDARGLVDGSSDAGHDAPSDAGHDAPSDAGHDAPSDAGNDASCSNGAWGEVDGDTADVAGDTFGRQTWNATLCRAPELGEAITLHVRARITAPGTESSYDLFPTEVFINGVGGSSGTLRTWTAVSIRGTSFQDYRVELPADVDGDGAVDWVEGVNELDMSPWSGYNPRPGRTGVDAMWLGP